MKTLGLFLVAAFAGTLFAQAPPVPRGKPTQQAPVVGTTSSTGPHQAILNYANASCTMTANCNIQIYRAVCSSPSSCPTYAAGNSAWTALNMSVSGNPAANVGVNGTSWMYTDKDPALQDSTTYVWVATNTYVGGTNPSPASANYSGTTNNGTPPAPTLATSGNSVN